MLEYGTIKLPKFSEPCIEFAVLTIESITFESLSLQCGRYSRRACILAISRTATGSCGSPGGSAEGLAVSAGATSYLVAKISPRCRGDPNSARPDVRVSNLTASMSRRWNSAGFDVLPKSCITLAVETLSIAALKFPILVGLFLDERCWRSPGRTSSGRKHNLYARTLVLGPVALCTRESKLLLSSDSTALLVSRGSSGASATGPTES